MSLFKARDWWSTQCGADEEFDKGCLCTANIDNSSDGSVKIIVGSYSGILRIYKPQPVRLEGGSYSSFRPDELLLEVQLKAPIIQVQSGMLVSSTNLLHLAVLHPFKLSIYLIAAVQGTVDHGTHYNLSLAYEHTFQRHAFYLVLGSFGGVKGKDFICVQSLDGTLNFYEQESFAFSRFLPNTLLPGPLTYVAKTDSFITVSGFSVESYRFQVLAVAKDATEDENVNFKGKRVVVDWSYNLGEAALDVLTIVERNQTSIILVLGEKSLYALNPNGTLKFAKKFDFSPSCFLPHNEGIDGSLIILIATLNQTLLVYHEKELKWAALLPLRPVCVQRATFMGVKGVLVLLSAQGNLAVCYLGTEPSLFVTPITEAKEINFEEAEKEMQELKKLIKSSNQNLLGTQNLGNEVSITITMPYHLDTLNNDRNEEVNNNFGDLPSITVKVQLKCTTVVHDVRLMIHVESPLKVSQSVYTFGSVIDYSQAIIKVFLDSPYIPTSLKFSAHVAYTSSQGAPRVFESSSQLPFSLVSRACPPSKEATHKITIDINKKVIPASDLFSDLSPDSSSVSGGAMGLEYYGGQQVTIMPSKSAQRYRMQSDDFSSMYLVILELIRRLKYKYRKEDDNSKLSCEYSAELPLQEYFNVIDDHFEKRQQILEMESILCQRAEQFRVVQKRLLTKLKDKTPTPLNNLDTLLEATHRHILTLAEAMDKHTIALQSSNCSLSCATQLLLLLLKLSVNIKEDEYVFVSACFSPFVDFDALEGWEEKLNVALTYILRFCLGKGGNESNFTDSLLEMPKDVNKLKKHIALVINSIVKHGTINITGSYINTENLNEMQKTQSQEDLEDELLIPTGSKFAENKTSRRNSEPSDDGQNNSTLESLTDEIPGDSGIGYSDFPDDLEEGEIII